jgi:hypothetical protein
MADGAGRCAPVALAVGDFIDDGTGVVSQVVSLRPPLADRIGNCVGDWRAVGVGSHAVVLHASGQSARSSPARTPGRHAGVLPPRETQPRALSGWTHALLCGNTRRSTFAFSPASRFRRRQKTGGNERCLRPFLVVGRTVDRLQRPRQTVEGEHRRPRSSRGADRCLDGRRDRIVVRTHDPLCRWLRRTARDLSHLRSGWDAGQGDDAEKRRVAPQLAAPPPRWTPLSLLVRGRQFV